MQKISRRAFLATGIIGASMHTIPFPVWFEKYAVAQTPLTRYNVSSDSGKQMLEKYARAVNTMMNTAEGDPRAWVFQWYTHWVKGSSTKQAEITRIYQNPSDPRWALAQQIWNTCQAHDLGADENMFLPWHRMYVYFFERIVRSAVGDPSFTLPYWNYSSPDARAIPAQFRTQTDPLYKALFRPNRNTGVNQGDPIDEGRPRDYLNLDALKEGEYEPQEPRQGFCLKLDSELHGRVHVRIGDTTNMGSVPWAANDPVFWMHHCNIDRLWASWNRAGGKNPGSDWLAQRFVFADEQGNRVEATVTDFADISKLGYTYDRFEPVPSALVAGAAIGAAAAPQPTTLAAVGATGEIALRAEPVSVTLQPVAPAGAVPVPLAARVQGLTPNRQLYLVIKNLRAEAQPGVLYDVYLDLPPGSSPSTADAHYVGTLNFFDAVRHGGQHAAAAAANPSKFFSFNITDVAKSLQAKGLLSASPTVTIASVGAPAADAKPVVGEITLVEQ